MPRHVLLLLGTLLCAAPALGQIYADLTVSHGGEPLGTFRIRLEHEKAPRTVANFIGLATGQRAWINPRTGEVMRDTPYYDGLRFHRLDHDFVIQGGDPLGTGGGGPGYVFQDEFDPTLRHDGRYVVSMANSGICTNGSQFFITLASAAHLDDKHSVFGTVIDDATHPGGRAIVDGFTDATAFPTGPSEDPLEPIVIESVVLSGPDLATFDLSDPALGLPQVDGLAVTLSHDRDTDAFLLEWDRQAKWDYPLFSGTDLATWTVIGNLISMDAATGFQSVVTSLITGSRHFFRVPAIDYSDAPQPADDIFADGTEIALNVEGGTLTVHFDATAGDTWEFVPTGGGTPTGGTITDLGYPAEANRNFPVLPATGTYIRTGGSYAQLLSIREIVVILDGPAGPDGIEALQPILSFHSDNAGFYTGVVQNSSGVVDFGGTFVLVP